MKKRKYSYDEVKELLKEQRKLCAQSCYGNITENQWGSIENAPEPDWYLKQIKRGLHLLDEIDCYPTKNFLDEINT